jgi:hypothetical protein
LEPAAEDIFKLDTEPAGENMSFLGKTSPREMSRLSSPASDIFGTTEECRKKKLSSAPGHSF